MLTQSSVAQVKRKEIPRENASIVVTMRYYPRFLRKELRDEFISAMAPTKELLDDFNAAQRKLGDHNRAFPEVDYEHRFQLSKDGLIHLHRLALLARTKDVHLICVCNVGDKCHREILMLIAREVLDCPTGQIYNDYPVIEQRIPEFRNVIYTEVRNTDRVFSDHPCGYGEEKSAQR